MTNQELGIDGLGSASEVGHGAFGVVYRADQPAMGREVAIKVLPALDDAAASRFERECRATGAVGDHPHIVNVYGAGATPDGRRYLMMQYLSGGSLAAKLRDEGPLEWPDVVVLGIKLAGALETAHRSGILHRDVKPGNVLLSAQGEPSLCDFGIARLRDGATTSTGSVTATVEHAAPEVLTGAKSGVTSDIYSLASTLFMIMTGSAPFARDGDEGVAPMMMRIVQEPVPDLRVEGLPEPVAAAFERAMAKSPSDRFPSAEEFGEALREAQRSLAVPVTPMVVHGDVQGRLAMSSGDEPDGEGLTRQRLRPVAVAVAPVPARSRRRAGVLAAVGLASVVALIAGVVLTRGGSEKVVTDPGPQGSRAVTHDLGVIQAVGSTLQVHRVWTLSGKEGSKFRSAVTMTNVGDAAVATHDEVIPKEIASSVIDIEFQPAYARVIQADPVVQFQVDLAPGASYEFGYTAEVPADGLTKKRLTRFARARALAQDQYDADRAAEQAISTPTTEQSSDQPPLAEPANPPTEPSFSTGPTAARPPRTPSPTGRPTRTTSTTDGPTRTTSTTDRPAGTTSTTDKPPSPPAPPPRRPPATPGGVSCSAAQGEIRITWQAVTGGASYRVYAAGGSSVLAERTTTEWTDKGLEPNSTHAYDVTAVNNDGESGRGSCSAKVPLPPPPTAPAQLTGQGGVNQRVPLSWSAVAGAARYRVFTGAGTVIANDVGATSYTVSDPGLRPCSSVSYAVSAVDKWGQEGPKRVSAAIVTGQRGGPTARNGAITIRNNVLITVQTGDHTGVADPDGSADQLAYMLTYVNFDGANFSFSWNSAGTFQIKGPAGFTGERFLRFKVRDRCGVESPEVTLTIKFFTQA